MSTTQQRHAFPAPILDMIDQGESPDVSEFDPIDMEIYRGDQTIKVRVPVVENRWGKPECTSPAWIRSQVPGACPDGSSWIALEPHEIKDANTQLRDE